MSAGFTLGDLAAGIALGTEDSALTAELKSGSEEAFARLIARYQAPVYSLISRILTDPSDASDITQDVFIKVFRNIGGFHGDSSLRTWIYRIALHEASNQRRWWFRHKGREVTIEMETSGQAENSSTYLKDLLVDEHASPYELTAHEELRRKVEAELRQLPEPFATVVILRDLEGMSYDEIAEILGTHLGTVKSRLVRGRAMLRQRLQPLITRTHKSDKSLVPSPRTVKPSVQDPICEEAI